MSEAEQSSNAEHGSFLNRAKAAGKLVAKQAEHTKLTKVTLANAYQELGKHVYDSGSFRDEMADLYQKADGLRDQIKKIDAHSEGPKAEGLAAKAKAAASATKDMAERKVLSTRLNSTLAGLGKSAFEKHGDQSGPENLVGAVRKGLDRLAILDGEIAQLSVVPTGQIITPKRIAIGGAVLVALLVALIGIRMVAGPQHGLLEKQNAETAEQAKGLRGTIAEADKLWDANQADKAVEKYVTVLTAYDHSYSIRDQLKDDVPRVYARVIDQQVKKGLTAPATLFIKQAISNNVALVLTSPEANDIFAEAQQEVEAKNEAARERMRQRREQKADSASSPRDSAVGTRSRHRSTSRQSSTNREGGSNEVADSDRLDAFNSIQKGMSHDEVQEILGVPDVRNATGVDMWMYYLSDKDIGYVTFDINQQVVLFFKKKGSNPNVKKTFEEWQKIKKEGNKN